MWAVGAVRIVAHVCDEFFHKFDPLPVPGRDFGIVIDCVEVAS